MSYRAWTLIHSLGLLICCSYLIAESVNLIPVFALISFFLFLIIHRREMKQIKPIGGYANWVTLLRLIIILTIMTTSEITLLSAQIGFIIALILDGVDGYIARRTKSESLEGTRFDMEVDAFFVLAITLFIWSSLGYPIWIISLGLFRYAYVILLYGLRLPERPEPPSYFKKTTTVISIGVMIVILILPEVNFSYTIALPITLLVLSFGHSFYFQLTNKWIPIF